MRQLAEDIQSGAIRSKSGEGYFVLKGEFYDAIEAGRKTTEYRECDPYAIPSNFLATTIAIHLGRRIG